MSLVEKFRKDFPDDDACLEWLVKQRYPNGCPVCGKKMYRISGRKSYVCNVTPFAHQVSPMAGTIFHKSATPLSNWFYAIYLFSIYGNELNAVILQRHLKVSYKTAWRMLWAIRGVEQPNLRQEKKANVGIYLMANGKYRARTKVGGRQGKQIELGTFKTPAEARRAYRKAKDMLKTQEYYSGEGTFPTAPKVAIKLPY